MTEPAAPLRPLHEADDAIRRLERPDSGAGLAPAIRTVAAAVDRSLRLFLRSAPGVPEAQRHAALSPADLSSDDVVRTLRSRDLVSIRLAGSVHALRSAAERAEAGETRPGDGELAREAVRQVRRELGGSSADDATAADRPATGGTPATPAPAKLSAEGDEALPPERQGRGMAWLAAGIALLFVVLMAWVLVRGSGADYDRAVSMFRAGRMDSAAVVFRQVLADRPHDVSSMLYLGRIHRRQGELEDAATVLRAAVGEAPRDPYVRRELGHLFMDLRQYGSAVGQYERAVEYGPEDPLNWASLIRALQAADDPRAERLLREAPPEVRARLTGGGG